MINSRKKGFTLVELVIVIAVIAILAAVLIPTFSSLVKKANLSADKQAERQLNTLLATEFATEKPDDLRAIVDMLDANGYRTSLEPLSKGYVFAWDKENNKIVLVLEAEAGSYAANLADGAKYYNENVSTSEGFLEALNNGSDITLSENVTFGLVANLSGDVTIDMNGYNLDASANDSRPFNLQDGAVLTINAEGSTINCGLYGLINVIDGANATIVINGGTYLADTKDGSFIRLRENSNVNITLNDVTYEDKGSRSVTQNGAYIIDNTLNEATGTITINGGSFTGNYGFIVPNMSVSIKNAKIFTNYLAIEAGKGADFTIENCKIETLKKFDYPAAVFVSFGAKLTIIGSTFSGTAENAYGVFPTGGTLVASNNIIEVANEYYVYTLEDGATASVTINGVTK